MDGRGLQRDDHLIATRNKCRLGNKRYDLGWLAETGQLERGHHLISSEEAAGELMMTATARRCVSAAMVASPPVGVEGEGPCNFQRPEQDSNLRPTP
jgi:hypothetical protein